PFGGPLGGRARRQHPARACGSGGAVLLRLPARAVREPADPTGAPRTVAAPRPVGPVSRHAVGPEPRRLDGPAAVERAALGMGRAGIEPATLGLRVPCSTS